MKNEQNNLSLEEMLRLAEKVKDWKVGEPDHFFYGSLEELNFLVGTDPFKLFTNYIINVNYKDTTIGRYMMPALTKNGKKIKKLYETLETMFEGYVKKKEKEGLKYARSLL